MKRSFVALSRKKSIGSIGVARLDPAAEAVLRVDEDVRALAARHRGGDLVGEGVVGNGERRHLDALGGLGRVVGGDDLLEGGLLLAAVGVPDDDLGLGDSATRGSREQCDAGRACARRRVDFRSIAFTPSTCCSGRQPALGGGVEEVQGVELDHELDPRPDLGARDAGRPWRRGGRRPTRPWTMTSWPSGSTISTSTVDLGRLAAAAAAPRPGCSRGGCRPRQPWPVLARRQRPERRGHGEAGTSRRPGVAPPSAIVAVKKFIGGVPMNAGDEEVGRAARRPPAASPPAAACRPS